MSKEVSNSKEETTCDDSLNFGFDDCIADVSSKGVSDLKACLDYSYQHARSCENLNFCFPDQTEPLY